MVRENTIGETIEELRKSLRDYIEATYHISHPLTVRLRRTLLDTPGVSYQRPYLESTPRYKLGPSFNNLGLDVPTLEILETLLPPTRQGERLIHDPPFHHQARALVASSAGKSLVVMTGTGSGKTECFLFPVLAKLASSP